MITFLGNGKNTHVYEDIIWRYGHEKDIIVSCQYPYLIPPSIVNCGIPVVNIHYGLLPYYRGVSPVYWQMMTSSESGVTLHYVDEKFDTGDIIDTYSFPHHGHTADEVYAELEKRGAWLLNEWILNILDGTAPRKKQGEGKYYKKEAVDWNTEYCCFPIVSREFHDVIDYIQDERWYCGGADINLYYMYEQLGLVKYMKDVLMGHLSYHNGTREKDATAHRLATYFQDIKFDKYPPVSDMEKIKEFVEYYKKSDPNVIRY